MFTAEHQPTTEQRVRKECRKGHLLEGDNVRIEPSTAKRRCRKCEASRRKNQYQEGVLEASIKANPRKYDLEDLGKAARQFVLKRVNDGTPFSAIPEAVLGDLRNDEIADSTTLTDADFQTAAKAAALSPLHCYLWDIHFHWTTDRVSEAIYKFEDAYPDLGIRDKSKTGIPTVAWVVWWWLRVTCARRKNFGGVIPRSFAPAIVGYLDQRPIKADVGPYFGLFPEDFTDSKRWVAP
jgi:hypothetical protein